MDTEHELGRAKLLIGAVVLFIISVAFSWNEFAYLFWGDTIDATITSVREVQTGRRGRTIRTRIEFTFADKSGSARNEYDNESEGWTPSGKTIAVQYIPGAPGRSRLDGSAQWWWPVICGVCLLFVLYKCITFWREFSAYERERKAQEALYG